MGFRDGLKHVWSVFTNQPQNDYYRLQGDLGPSTSHRPDRGFAPRISNDRSIVSAIYMRMAMDASSVDIRHVLTDSQGRYKEDVKSGLNECLTVEANIDQTARALKFDFFMSLFEQGDVALMPIETDVNPDGAGSVNILTMRVGRIVNYYPRHVRIEVYNDRTGRREEITRPKERVAIVENPFFTVMNEPNSMFQRLLRKLALLDIVDEQSSSGKLDMIIQLPYVISNETMKKKAEDRRKDIEFQLKDSRYGIAYTDGTEKITQLNRPVENGLLKQIESHFATVYAQLGITIGIMNGEAEEAVMLNYTNRTIEPLVSALADEIKRKFLSKNARSRGQDIQFFRDPFTLVPMKDLAEMADKFTRNEIVTSNEFRGFMGIVPSPDPKADELRNSNLYGPEGQPVGAPASAGAAPVEEDADDPYAGLEEAIDSAFKGLEDLGVPSG